LPYKIKIKQIIHTTKRDKTSYEAIQKHNLQRHALTQQGKFKETIFKLCT
jgi:ACT domain-containing protein